MSSLGRKSPLGGHGWISSPERREAANSGHSPTVGERLLILKAVIQKSCGNRRVPILSCHSGEISEWQQRQQKRSFRYSYLTGTIGQEPTFGYGHYIRLLCVKLESQDRDIVILGGLTLEFPNRRDNVLNASLHGNNRHFTEKRFQSHVAIEFVIHVYLFRHAVGEGQKKIFRTKFQLILTVDQPLDGTNDRAM
jgi:hypothetical protein